MAGTMNVVLTETFGARSGAGLRTKQAALVIAGIAAMIIAAKIRVPFWPVPATMQTFVVLSVGAAYGMRLGLVTMLGYLLIGALGFDVFTSSSAESHGLSYMMGATGGYLVGFVVAAGVMGWLARRGWDRSFGWMALAMLIGNAIVYAFGMPWMFHLFGETKGAAWVWQWGMTNFLTFDAAKLALAAVLFPAIWKAVGSARS
ncbi:biotin transporter BioY [Frigidibacter sp. ROC022]|uniref:biotin transporter BioY n=1 Tax=Frigidibacter sp. ROC022 TaxID=2971796 RepID=UPI00215B3AAD|nr:biotin transporter BioY [Frigidibacter sp. ROC022]MCR8725560.1 biotin transporter BioY [Frigidibacter sp. ROC022]